MRGAETAGWLSPASSRGGGAASAIRKRRSPSSVPAPRTFFAPTATIFPRPADAAEKGNVAKGETLISRRPRGLELGSNVVIRTYQAEHGGLAFESAPTRRQK